MPVPILGPRKRRTRQHVIADLGIHHVERYILECGHVSQRLGSDYGYDLVMWTFDETGFVEPGVCYFQVKATESAKTNANSYLFDIEIRDYNLWKRKEFPVVLILFEASRRRAYWLAIQEYFRSQLTAQPKRGAKTVRIRIPKWHVVGRRAIGAMRELKWAALEREWNQK